MNSTPRPPRWRACACAVGVGLMLLLSGCVYLRLLQLKRQLGDFDRNFTLTTSAGLRLDCLNPVLLETDLHWLGFRAATIDRVGSAERWHVRWVKQLPPGVQEKKAFEIAFSLIFAGDRLTAFVVPEHYFGLLPKEMAVAGIRSLAGAKVDKSSRSVEGDVAFTSDPVAARWPTRQAVLEVLGHPTEEFADSGRTVLRYRCLSADPQRKGGEFDLRFGFDPATQNLVQLHGRIPAGRISLNFSPPAGSSAAAP